MDHKSTPKRRFPLARIGLSALCVVLSLVLIVMAVGTVYIHNMLGKINRLDDDTLSTDPSDFTIPEDTIPSDFTGPSVDPSEVTVPIFTGPAQQEAHIVNIMLVGQDRRPGADGRTLSDTMILCTINTESNTITLTSFLRDIYVYIPGYSKEYNRLNVAYKVGGTQMLSDTMLANFGIIIDHFVVVDFDGFKDIVNALGGIDMYLTAEEAEFMNTYTWDGLDSTGWALKEGINHLDGDQALGYTRIRKIDSDFGRSERQRKMLTAILEKYRNTSVDQLFSLLNSLLPMISTDMSNNEITSLAMALLPMLKSTDLVNQRVPIKGSYEYGYVGKSSVIIVDFEKNQQFLQDMLRGN